MPDKNYSHRTVTDKLGIKVGMKVRVVGKGDKKLLAEVRAKTGKRFSGATATVEVILYSPQTFLEVVPTLTQLKTVIVPHGGIWVITPKKGFPNYLKQDDLIPLGQQAGLVDNKICSISEKESALRFVIRKKDRPTKL